MQNAFSHVSEEEAKVLVNKMNTIDNKSKYLILLEGEYISNEEESFKTFDIIVGRQKAYEYIKQWLVGEDDTNVRIDVIKSRILVEPEVITEKTPRITLSNMLNIYRFMKNMKEQEKIIDDDSSFDIDDFYDGDLIDPSEEV